MSVVCQLCAHWVMRSTLFLVGLQLGIPEQCSHFNSRGTDIDLNVAGASVSTYDSTGSSAFSQDPRSSSPCSAWNLHQEVYPRPI